MPNTITIATEGLLQEDGQGGSCVNVVARENTKHDVTVATRTDVVVPPPTATASAVVSKTDVSVKKANTPVRSARVRENTIIAQSGCGAGTGGGAPIDHVHSFGDITDFQTFYPSTRFFAETGQFVFDCDPVNADDGITDPYKFITLSALFDAVLELAARLPAADGNLITIRLADGAYDGHDLTRFLQSGNNNSTFSNAYYTYAYRYNGVGSIAIANTAVIIESKSTPTVITNGEWDTVSSTAAYASEWAASAVVNQALIEAAFGVHFAYTYADGKPLEMQVPANIRLNGLAIFGDPDYSLRASVCTVGAKGAALFFTQPYNALYNYDFATPALRTPYAFTVHEDGMRMYVVHGGASLNSLRVDAEFARAIDLVLVNPNYTTFYGSDIKSPLMPGMQMSVAYLGAMSTVMNGNGWLAVDPDSYAIYTFGINTVPPTDGNPALNIGSNRTESFVNIRITSAIGVFSGTIKNSLTNPVFIHASSLFYTDFPNRIGGFQQQAYNFTHVKPVRFVGSGDPNGAQVGSVGDTFASSTGAPLWAKETGNNTNTGWKSVSFNKPHLFGTGSPEGVVTADVGQLYSRLDPIDNNSLVYAKRVGNGTPTGWNYFVTLPAAAPVANFIGTPLSGNAPLNVTFNDLSTNSPTSWAWTFGDGGTSTAQNPTYNYSAGGTYTVTLIATNAIGSDTETKTAYVSVDSAYPTSFFTGADDGVFYDFSVPGSLAQAAYGTDSVATGGQPIGAAMNLAFASAPRKNLLVNSEQLNAAGSPWVANSITVAVLSGQDPVTGRDAFQMTDVAVSADHRFTYPQFTMVAGVYTMSVYAKLAAGVRGLRLVCSNFNNWSADFNLSTGTISASSGCTPAIVALGGGWYRCSAQFTAVAAASNLAIQISNGIYTGDGSSIIVASPQLELGSLSVLQPIRSTVFNGTAAARPIADSRYNQQLKTEDFSDAVYRKYNATITSNTTLAPDGTMTADSITGTGGGVVSFDNYPTFYDVSNVVVTHSVHFRAGGAGVIRVQQVPSAKGASIDTSTLAITDINGGTGAVEDLGGGWYRFSASYLTNQFNFCNVAFDPANATSTATTIIWGFQSVYGSAARTYQWVNTTTSYNWSLAPLCAKFDAVDDTLNSVSFTLAGTKRTVCLAVRDLSNGASSPFFNKTYTAYSGASNGPIDVRGDGTTVLTAGGGGGLSISQSGFSAPYKASIISECDTTTPILKLMVNGVETSSSATQSGNTYGSSPIAIGSGQGFSPFGNVEILAALLINRDLTAGEKATWNAFAAGLLGP